MARRDPKHPRMISEEIELTGRQLLDKVQDLAKAGNVRKIIIRRPTGEIVFQYRLTPLTVIVGLITLLAPVAMLIVAFGLLATPLKVQIVREEQ